MQARYVVWSIALASGCGGAAPKPVPPPEPAPPPVAVTPPDAVKTTPEPVPAAPPPAPPLTDRAIAKVPGAPACKLHDAGWYGKLSFAADAAPFATVIAANTTMSLPQAGSGMFAQIDDGGIRIGAWSHEPTLHLARAVALSKIVYPRPVAKVSWEGLQRTGAVAISLDVSSALSEPTTASAEVACKDLSIAEASYKLPSSIPAPTKGEIILTGETPLSATPGGKPVAKVQQSPTVTLMMVGKRGAATHILIDDPDFVVHGWIPTSAIDEGVGLRMGRGVGYVNRSARITQPNSENQDCVRDLPLFVEFGGNRAEVGVFVAGHPHPHIVDKVDAAGFIGVEPYGRQWLALEPGARLVMREADRALCHTPK
ncbi:MAG: hypothetical protein IPQ07_39045 [Myxococcales bacterium]|nr:hypothetical protein [Myxococcales bacterium]